MNTHPLIPCLLLAVASPTALLHARQDAPEAPVAPAQPVPRLAETEAAPAERAAFLGVVTGEVPAAVAAQLRLDPETGLMVESVTEGSAAHKAGIRQHDVLLRFGDQILVSPRQLTVLLRARKPGETVTLNVLRGGQPVDVAVELGERPNRPGRMIWTPREAPSAPGAPTPAAAPGAPVTGSVREIIINREGGEPIIVRIPSGEHMGAMAAEIAAAVGDGVGRVVQDIDIAALAEQAARAVEEGGTIEIDTEAIRERMALLRERLAELDHARAEDMAKMADDHARGVRHVTVLRMSDAKRVYDGPEGSATLETVDGVRRFTMRDPEGNEVFAGPVGDEAQRAAMPEAARALLTKLEDARIQYHFEGEAPEAPTPPAPPPGGRADQPTGG